MKHLKKILAAALSGVLALTLLAGCGSWGSINKAELIKQVGDYSRVTYRDMGESQASAVEDALKQTIDLMKESFPEGSSAPSSLTQMALNSLANYVDDTASSNAPAEFIEIQHALYKTLNFDPEGYTYGFFSLTALSDFESSQFQNSLENMLAQNILSNHYRYHLTSKTNDIGYSNHGTVSLKVITLDGSRYVLGFWTIAA